MIVPPTAWAGGASDDVLRALFVEIFMATYTGLSALVPMAHSLRDNIHEGTFVCLVCLHSFGEKTAILGRARRLA